MQSTLNDSQDDAWEQLLPLLDEAMTSLSERDQSALVMRYFEGKTASEIAAVLKVNEDAAQKRVTRALEKLRTVFHKHGVSSTTAIIAGAISAHAVQAAPSAMAGLITSVALAKGAAAGSSTLLLVKGVLKYMAWRKAQSAIIVAISVLLLGSGATIVTLAKNKVTQNQSTGRITSSVSGTTSAGRQVKASGDIPLGITVEGDSATVRLGEQHFDAAAGKLIADHNLVFETQRVLLDGKERTRIPSSTTVIEIICTNQTVSIVADEKLVLTSKFGK